MKRALYIFAALFLLVMNGAALAQDAEKGRAVYERHCWWCHGKDGAGDGPAASLLNPPPRDFTLGLYKWKSTPYDEFTPSDDDFMSAVKGYAHDAVPGWTGLAGTSMSGWGGVMTDAETRDAIAYVKSLGMLEGAVKEAPAYKRPARFDAERWKKVFSEACSECHGEGGRGDARKKLRDDWGARTWPRNLAKGWTFRAGSKVEDIYARVTVGIPGTQMPSFADPASKKMLSEEERWDVARYAASLDEPEKRPSGGGVIRAVRATGALPSGADDAAWGSAPYEWFFVFPQILSGEMLHTPTTDSIGVKALYNADEVAVLAEWDDYTKSVPGDAKAAELAEGELYEDAFAVELPVAAGPGAQRPYFGMGGPGRPVEIWHWKAGGVDAPQSAALLTASGAREVQKIEADGLSATGYYEKGTWRVVFRKRLSSGQGGVFREGAFVPVSFAAWDGSNSEAGARHVMTGWNLMYMEPGAGYAPYVWAALAALAVFIVEMLWLRSARKG